MRCTIKFKYLRYLLLFIIILPGNTPYLFSQKTIKVSDVRGECIISNITPEQAKQQAILEAKREALRRAGVSENVGATSVLKTTEDKNGVKQLFDEISSVEINGEVLNYTVTKENKRINEYNNIVVEITLDAEVIKYDKKKDLSFDIVTNGIDDFYKNGQVLAFDFTPGADGYLRIFNINDTENIILYPYNDPSNKSLNDVPDRLFKKNEKIKFPINKLFGNPETKETGYVLSTEKQTEFNHLVFVYTKQNIPFYKTVNYQNIISWIYSISPDQRVVKYYGFLITNKEPNK